MFVKKGLMLASILFFFSFSVSAQNVDTTQPWHYLQQLAKGPNGPGPVPDNMTRIDADGNGVIDLTEFANDCDELDGINSSVFLALGGGGGVWNGAGDIWYNAGGVSVGTNAAPTHDFVVAGDANISQLLFVGNRINTTGQLHVSQSSAFYSNLAIMGFLATLTDVTIGADLHVTGGTVNAANVTIADTLNTSQLDCIDCISLGSETAGILPPSEGGTGANSLANFRTQMNASIKMNTSCPPGQSLQYIDSNTYVCSGTSYMLTSENGTMNALYVNNDSNVGIGMDNATYKLQVNGNFKANTWASIGGSLFVNRHVITSGNTVAKKNLSVNGTVYINESLAVNRTLSRASLDVSGQVWANEVCDETGANCQDLTTLAGGGGYDMKLSTANHNGNFGGYDGMYAWIQANGCAGYHVCTAHDITLALQHGNKPALPVGAWMAGVDLTSCSEWSSSAAGNNGAYMQVLAGIYTPPSWVSCNSNLPVLCCN